MQLVQEKNTRSSMTLKVLGHAALLKPHTDRNGKTRGFTIKLYTSSLEKIEIERYAFSCVQQLISRAHRHLPSRCRGTEFTTGPQCQCCLCSTGQSSRRCALLGLSRLYHHYNGPAESCHATCARSGS